MRLGLLEIVFIILLVLKLLGIITLSWWWVFSPLLLALVILVISVLSVIIYSRSDVW